MSLIKRDACFHHLLSDRNKSLPYSLEFNNVGVVLINEMIVMLDWMMVILHSLSYSGLQCGLMALWLNAVLIYTLCFLWWQCKTPAAPVSVLQQNMETGVMFTTHHGFHLPPPHCHPIVLRPHQVTFFEFPTHM